MTWASVEAADPFAAMAGGSISGALRRRLMGLGPGGSRRVAREVFMLVERRGCLREIEGFVEGRDGSGWHRTWAEVAEDQLCLWASPQHRQPDLRTPVMCALQATPRHSLLARLRVQPGALAALQALAQGEPHTLTGITAKKALALGSGGDRAWGAAARAAVAEWREAAVAVLLRAGGGATASHVDHAGRTALHYAAAAGDGATARLLLAAGADADALDGCTCLVRAECRARGGGARPGGAGRRAACRLPRRCNRFGLPPRCLRQDGTRDLGGALGGSAE